MKAVTDFISLGSKITADSERLMLNYNATILDPGGEEFNLGQR